MKGRHTTNPTIERALRIAVSACLVVVLAISGVAIAQNPAASMLPPTAPSTRPAESPSLEAPPTTSSNTESPTDLQKLPGPKFPPAFSSQRSRSFPVLGAVFKKSAPEPVEAPVEKTKINTAPPTPVWRWYGYGAPVPGLNPLAPQGVYAPVPARWYVQSGSTPGAIPQPMVNPFRPAPGEEPPTYLQAPALPTPHPILPQPLPLAETEAPVAPRPKSDSLILPPGVRPMSEEPPLSPAEQGKTAPAPIIQSDDDVKLPGDMVPAVSARPAAAFEGVVRPAGAGNPAPEHQESPAPKRENLILPPEGASNQSPVRTQNRAQAPTRADEGVPADVVETIRRVCDDRVIALDIQRAGSRALVIRIEARNLSDAQAIANRIAAVKTLAGWHVVYEAMVK